MYTFDIPEILWEAGFDLLEVINTIAKTLSLFLGSLRGDC